MKQTLEGVLPALITPLDSNEQVATDAAERLLQRLYEAGSDGMYVCGQTGEGLFLDAGQRMRMTEVSVRNSPPGKAVVIHVGAPRTAEAVALARHARKSGAHAVASLPPASSFSFAEVRAYYEAIAQAADLPVLVYYFPEFSKSVSTLEEIFELCSIPNVIGLKFTDFDFYRMSLVARAGHVIFNGRDEAFAAGILMGASGGIGSFYNLVPELFVQAWTAGQRGDFAETRKIQDRINDLIRVVLRYPMLPAMKQLLTWSGVPCGPCIAPRRALTGDEEGRLQKELSEIGFEPGGFLRYRSTVTA